DYKVPGNDDAIRSVSLLTRVMADAVADGLIARAGGGSAEEGAAEAEPMAEWERELLAGAEGTEATAPATAEGAAETPAAENPAETATPAADEAAPVERS